MQANIYRDAKKFVSFKKTISEMGSNYSHIPMFSLQSISKGYYGEHQHSRGSLLNLQSFCTAWAYGTLHDSAHIYPVSVCSDHRCLLHCASGVRLTFTIGWAFSSVFRL